MVTTWLDTLRAECARRSQAQVAKLLSYSPAVVNQVLQGSYRGDLKAVQKAVEGVFLGAVVQCPVLGEIASNRCLEEQAKPFAATNAQRVALYRACRGGCPHSRLHKHDSGVSHGNDD